MICVAMVVEVQKVDGAKNLAGVYECDYRLCQRTNMAVFYTSGSDPIFAEIISGATTLVTFSYLVNFKDVCTLANFSRGHLANRGQCAASFP